MELKKLRKQYQSKCFLVSFDEDSYYHIISIKENNNNIGNGMLYRLYYDYIYTEGNERHLIHYISFVDAYSIDSVLSRLRRVPKFIYNNKRKMVVDERIIEY